jgi:hypothetical protein
MLWTNDPANPQSGRQGLADRTQPNDSFRPETLDLPDWLPVVAEFGVIVIFDNETIAIICPLQQRVPPLWSKNDPSRRLMRGSENNSARSCRCQRIYVDTMLVDSNRDSLQPGTDCDQAIVHVARVFNADLPDAETGERSKDEVQSLSKTGADDEVFGFGNRPTNPA